MHPQTRVSDAECQQVADLLREGLSAGRLTVEEFSDRTAAAYAARTGADLAALTADLPQPHPTASDRRTTRSPWRTPTVAVVTAVVVALLLAGFLVARPGGLPVMAAHMTAICGM